MQLIFIYCVFGGRCVGMSLSAVCSNSTKDWLPCARFVCFCSANTPIHTHTKSQIAYHFSLYSLRFLTLMMIYQLLLSWILLLLCTGVWKIIVQLVEVLYVAISYLPFPPHVSLHCSLFLAIYSSVWRSCCDDDQLFSYGFYTLFAKYYYCSLDIWVDLNSG